MISRITEGLSDTQIRVVRVRFLFLMIKVLTDFLLGFGAAFTAAGAKEGPLSTKILVICFVAGLVMAAKNLGDALSAALPPPVVASPPPSSSATGSAP